MCYSIYEGKISTLNHFLLKKTLFLISKSNITETSVVDQASDQTPESFDIFLTMIRRKHHLSRKKCICIFYRKSLHMLDENFLFVGASLMASELNMDSF